MTARLAFVVGAFIGAFLGGLVRDLDVLVPGGRPSAVRGVIALVVYAAAAVVVWVVYWHAYDRGHEDGIKRSSP